MDESKPSSQQATDVINHITNQIMIAPVRLGSKIAKTIQPYTTQLLAISIVLFLVPILITLSLYAGFFVWKSVAVSWKIPLYLQYGDGVPPWAEAELPRLVSRQRYDFSLDLSIPVIPSNFVLGNFMTTLTLATPQNATIASIRRPSIAIPVQSKSWLSSTPTVINIDIPLFSNLAPGSSRVIARIILGRQDGWTSLGTGEGRELTVLNAYLRGAIRYHGVRGLVTRFPLVFALISALTFLIISTLILIAFVIPAISWETPEMGTQSTAPHLNKTLPTNDDDDGSGDFKPPRSRRSSKRKASGSLRNSIASGSGQDVKSEASTSEPTLRRRRSRLSDSDATLLDSH